jgi:hypothetical protein
MVRPVRLTFLLPMLVGAALHAQAPAPLAAPAAVTPADGSVAARSAPRAELPRAPRAISPDVAAQLAASRPKFSPVAPPPPPKPEEELPDLRETDKPKNTIVRLPKFVVQEPRPAVFTERDIYSKKGLENLAMRRYLTETDLVLNRFKLPLFGVSNADRAMAMYAEDERLKNMSEVADRTNMVMRTDATAGAKVKSEAQQTFMRWQDMGWQGGAPK